MSSLCFTAVGDVFNSATLVEQIQARLADVSVATMTRATGLWRLCCTMIRRADFVPNPRH